MSDYFDRDLNSMDSWSNDSTKWAGKRVLATWVGKYRVSTVWLGLDHSYEGGEPVVFETMFFDHSDSPLDAVFERHYSEEEAARYHLRALDAIRAGAVPSYDDDWMGGAE